MTPDDMEEHLEAVARSLGDGDFTRVTFPEGVAKKTATGIRALLLDYQERGRALEAAVKLLRPFAEAAPARARLADWSVTETVVKYLRDAETFVNARATLKGKS
jgi:hypothetical protein